MKLRILAGIILSLFIGVLVSCNSFSGAGTPSNNALAKKTTAKTGPIISGLQPAVTAAGAPQVVVSVMGDNFDGKAVVLWNKTPRATRLISATQLQVSLTSKDVAVPGTAAVAVSNTANGITSNSTTFTVVQGGPAIATTSLPAASSGVLYSTTLAATGGTPPYSWSATGLPAGLVVSSTGTILGTPTTAGTFPVGLHLSDSTGAIADQATSLTVNSAPTSSRNLLSINTTSLPSGTVGSAYSAALNVSGGTAPYSWSAESLPAGLTFSSGAISGTPSASGTFGVGFVVTDSTGASATTNLAISIVTATLVLQITTATLPQGTLETQYSATLSAIGGSPSYTWGIDSGSLPPSLVLDPTNGTIAGTLSVAGEFPFDVQVKDATQKTASKSLVVSVSPSTQCLPPNYCGDTSTGLKPYPSPALSGANNPPALNTAFTDPVFNRKIWRVTDTTTDQSGNQASYSPSWGQADGNFNANQTLLLVPNGSGSTQMVQLNPSNPAAPIIGQVHCSGGSWPGGMCTAGLIKASESLANVIFTNLSPSISYGWGAYSPNMNRLFKRDWTATVASINGTPPTATTPPTDTMVFDPFATGHCMDGLTASQSNNLHMGANDDYFWGVGDSTGRGFIYKLGADCKRINNNVSPWTISGDTSWGSATNGALKTLDVSGNDVSGTNPISACHFHGVQFDPTSMVANLSLDTSTCPSETRHFWLLNLQAMTIQECPSCGTHDPGPIHTPAGSGYLGMCFGLSDCPAPFVWNFKFYPYSAPASTAFWGSNITPDPSTAGGMDWHPGGSWNTGWPYIAAYGFFQAGASYAQAPRTSLAVNSPYEGEQVIFTWDGSTRKLYRMVHNYIAGNGYNSNGLSYSWGAMTQLSPDKCWMAFSSNWLGQLGTWKGVSGGNSCDASHPQYCRSDVFLTYLCQ